jgi:hypothetical protein
VGDVDYWWGDSRIIITWGIVYYALNAAGPEVIPPVTPPVVQSTPTPNLIFIGIAKISPLNLAIHQNLLTNIVVTFNEAMNPITVNANTFKLIGPNNTNIAGVITSDATKKVWTFNPIPALKLNSVYTITVTTGAKGASGNSLEKNFVASFTTLSGSGGGDSSTTTTTTETLVLTTITLLPASTNVSVNSTRQLTAASLDQNGNAITATITYTTSNSTIANVSASGLVTGKAVGNATINASSGAISASSTIQVVTPVLTQIKLMPRSASLLNGSTKQLNATGFDQFGDRMVATITYNSSNTTVATVNASGFITTLAEGNTTINALSGAISNTSSIVVYLTLPTCAAPAFGLAGLGTAGSFAILSKSGITNVPTSIITGNIGTSPITGAAITGLGCPEVTGTIYTVDAAGPSCRVINASLLTTAISDMETAYTTAAGLPACVTELGAGDIGGLTLTSGVYKWSTDLGIATDVTLTGNSTDVWVFQVSKGLSIANGKKVTLAGGALPKNIFWVVAEGATLGTTSTIEGNILNLGSLATVNPIALNTGAILSGRALSQKAVTLQSNNVTIAN